MNNIFRSNRLTKSDFYFKEPNGANWEGDYYFATKKNNENKRSRTVCNIALSIFSRNGTKWNGTNWNGTYPIICRNGTERIHKKWNGTERKEHYWYSAEMERNEFTRNETEQNGTEHDLDYVEAERNWFKQNGMERNRKNRIFNLLKRNGTEWIECNKLRISFVPFHSIPFRSFPESKNVAGPWCNV